MIEILSNATVMLIVGALIGGLAKPAMADLWLALKRDWRLSIAGACFISAVALPKYVSHVLDDQQPVTMTHLQLVLATNVAVSALTLLAMLLFLFAVMRASLAMINHVATPATSATNKDPQQPLN